MPLRVEPPELDADFLAGVIDRVAHPIFVKDRSFRFVLVNRALGEMVGYPAPQMVGKTDYDFFPREEADFFRRKDVEMFATGSRVEVDEEPITDAAGRVHILATTKVPFCGPSGEVTHVVGIISDITRVKQAEEQLRDANQELERRVAARSAELAAAQRELLRKERLAVLGSLAGGLAHQLRNPLGAIQNAAALLRRGDPAQSWQALDIIDEEVQRADRIIRDLLDFARVRPPTCSPVPVGRLIESSLDLEVVPSSVRVAIDGADGTTAYVDEQQVVTALGNLIRNAIEAMPGGGELRFVVRPWPEGGDPAVRLTIHDTGHGVSDEVQKNLFDPLVTTKPLGVGLGLSTARNLIENQGGRVRHVPGAAGSSFEIELPARAAEVRGEPV